MAKKTTKKKTAKKPSKKKTSSKSVKRSSSSKETVSKKKTTKKTPSKKKKASTTKKSAPSKKKTTKKVKKAPASKTKTKAKTKKTTSKAKISKPTKKSPKTTSKSSSKKTTTKSPPSKTKSKTKKTTKKTKSSTSKTKQKKSGSATAFMGTPDKDGYVVYKGRRVRMISTKNVVKQKTNKEKEIAGDVTTTALIKEKKLPKTTLSKKELGHYRDLLLIKRAEQMGDLNAMEAEALQSTGGNLSHMPIHMADIGTDAYDQDFMLGLAENERQLIREIDQALQRIQDKTYGMCLMSGEPIPEARLQAKPWAKYTIEAARLIENGQAG